MNDFVTIPHDPRLDFTANEDFTVALWVKPDPTQSDVGNGDNDILEKWSGRGTGYPYVIRYFNRIYLPIIVND